MFKSDISMLEVVRGSNIMTKYAFNLDGEKQIIWETQPKATLVIPNSSYFSVH